MKAYKIFRVIDGELYSAIMDGKVKIRYKPSKQSKGKLLLVQSEGKKIKSPIFAFRRLKDARNRLKLFISWARSEEEKKELLEKFEIWEVKGSPWEGTLIGIAFSFSSLEKGIVTALAALKRVVPYMPRGTVLLSSCVPVRKVEVEER